MTAATERDIRAPLRVTLERMEPRHFPQVMAIERASFPDPWARVAFERETTNTFSRPIVAVDEDGDVVGYLIYWVAGPEYHVLNIAVRTDAQRRGVARAMMNNVIADALRDRADYVALEVRASNVPAKTLYARYGFVTVGIRPRYYKNSEDAEVMLLHLRT